MGIILFLEMGLAVIVVSVLLLILIDASRPIPPSFRRSDEIGRFSQSFTDKQLSKRQILTLNSSGKRYTTLLDRDSSGIDER